MLRIFDTFMKQFVVREVIVFMKLFKIICGMLMFAHFAACLWWFVGSKTNPSWIDAKDLRNITDDTFTQYSYAWYWAVVTLFTTGYGDVVATNTSEQWVCSICILIGTCFFAYFVGTLTVLITEGDKIKSYQSDKLEEAQSFCDKKKLPKELTHAILTHIRYHCTYNYVFDESELLNILPSYLQHDIHAYVSEQFLLQLKLFQNEYIHLPEFIIGLIAVKTKSISCNQSYKLYDVGDIAKEFYIQRTGKSTLYDKNGQVIDQLCRGSVCGEFSSFLFKKRKCKIECDTWSEFYSISIDDIRQILDLYYPKSSHSKLRQIKKYLKVAYKKNIKHSVELNQYNYMDENAFGHSSSLHSLPNASHSIAIHNVPIKYAYEDSIHLFENTRNKKQLNSKLTNQNHENDNENTNALPHTTLGFFDTSAIPPESDNDECDNYSPLNLKNCLSLSDVQITEHKTDNNNTNKKSKITSRIAKFKIRANSELRNIVVVAHGEKHNQLAIPGKSSGNNANSTTKKKLQKYKTAPQLRNNLKNWKSEELLNNTSERSLIITETEMTRKNYKNESATDSECSFSSISTDSSFDCEATFDNENIIKKHTQNKKNNNNIVKKKRNKPQKVKKKRKGKGKFGQAGKFKQNQRDQTNYQTNWRVTINDEHETNKRGMHAMQDRISSCESLVFLSPLQYEHIQSVDSDIDEISVIDSNSSIENQQNQQIDKPLFMQSIKSGQSIDNIDENENNSIQK